MPQAFKNIQLLFFNLQAVLDHFINMKNTLLNLHFKSYLDPTHTLD